MTASRNLRFDVLTATYMNMVVFRNVAARSLVDTNRRLRESYCLHYQGAIY
jgi:hypothetical protein